MKQLHVPPPNWDSLVAQFGVKWGEVAVTFGDTCYCKDPLPAHLEAHESVHAKQQKDEPFHWWARYCVDSSFRLEQELEAYKAQFKFMKTWTKDRNYLFKFRDKLARDLSGPMYGNIISYKKAFQQIGEK